MTGCDEKRIKSDGHRPESPLRGSCAIGHIPSRPMNKPGNISCSNGYIQPRASDVHGARFMACSTHQSFPTCFSCQSYRSRKKLNKSDKHDLSLTASPFEGDTIFYQSGKKTPSDIERDLRDLRDLQGRATGLSRPRTRDFHILIRDTLESDKEYGTRTDRVSQELLQYNVVVTT